LEKRPQKIAITHYTLAAMGGGERVGATLIEALNDVGVCPDVYSIAPIPKEYFNSFYGKNLHYRLMPAFPFRIKVLGIYQRILSSSLSFRLTGYDIVVNTTGVYTPMLFSNLLKRYILYIYNPGVMMKNQKYVPKPLSISKYEKSLFWKLYYMPYKTILSHSVRNVKAELLAVSRFTRWRLKKYAGMQSKVVYPPVDIKTFSEVFDNADRDGVISIGRFTPEKEQLKQLEIAKHLPDIIFRLCGSAKTPYYWHWYQHVKRKAEEMNLKNVEFYPNIPLEKLVSLVGKSKIFIHTMLYEDFGLTTAEAIAGGCIPCLKGQSIIYGDNIPISEVTLRSNVLTIKGREKPLRTMRRVYSGRMINVKVRGLPEVSFTPEHPILTSRVVKRHEYIKTDEIRQGKGRKRRYYIHKRIYYPTSPVWKKAESLKVGDYVLVPRSNKSNNFEDKDLAWLLGLYLAEGWLYTDSKKRHLVKFALGSHEKELMLKATAKLRSKFNSALVSREGSGFKIICSGRKPYEFFSICGKGALRKRIPELIKEAKPEIVREFIEGYVAGDGHKGEHSITCATVSKQLAFGLMEILLTKLAILPSFCFVNRKKGKICGRNVTLNSLYTISWSINRWQERGFRSTYLTDEKYIYIPIRKISEEYVDTPVFNLQTPSQTYCVPFIVHNCVIDSGGQKEIVPFKNLRFHKIKEAAGIINRINNQEKAVLSKLRQKLFEHIKQYDELNFKRNMLNVIFNG